MKEKDKIHDLFKDVLFDEERMDKWIEASAKEPNPLYDKLKFIPTKDEMFTYERKFCPKCGLDVSGVMGYCCPNVDCPCGLGPVT